MNTGWDFYVDEAARREKAETEVEWLRDRVKHLEECRLFDSRQAAAKYDNERELRLRDQAEVERLKLEVSNALHRTEVKHARVLNLEAEVARLAKQNANLLAVYAANRQLDAEVKRLLVGSADLAQRNVELLARAERAEAALRELWKYSDPMNLPEEIVSIVRATLREEGK